MLDVPRQTKGRGAATTAGAGCHNANRPWSSRLRGGNQIRKAAPVVRAKDEPDADEFWNCRAVPLCLPPRFLPGRRRTPISQIEALDIAHQFSFGGRGGGGGGKLVAMRGPGQDEATADPLQRDV